MNKFERILVVVVFSLTSSVSLADSYVVNLDVVSDYESLRPLFDSCHDLGVLEAYRPEIDMALDLEELRYIFEGIGYVEFGGCPSGL